MIYKEPTTEELRDRFLYHSPPNQERIAQHAQVSEACLALAQELSKLCPLGRNHSLMLTQLEDVRMRANAALACDSPDSQEEP